MQAARPRQYAEALALQAPPSVCSLIPSWQHTALSEAESDVSRGRYHSSYVGTLGMHRERSELAAAFDGFVEQIKGLSGSADGRGKPPRHRPRFYLSISLNQLAVHIINLPERQVARCGNGRMR